MCVPSVLDRTIAPEGGHVVNLFVQYAPYRLANGRSWDDEKEAYADKGTQRKGKGGECWSRESILSRDNSHVMFMFIIVHVMVHVLMVSYYDTFMVIL